MSKKSSKLMEISKMFDEIDIEFDKLSNEGINDMISIIKKQNDTRYSSNVKHKMEYCIICTYLEENIVLAVGNFKKKNEVKEYDYYTLREFRTFRRSIDNFVIKQFFNFMFFFGTRPSEAMALRFCDIKGDYILVCHSIHRRGKRELDTPKNQSSIRYLKLSVIARIRILALKCFYIKHNGECPDEYFIFGGKKPLSSSTIDRHKRKACEKAKIREITQHQFRHSYATRMIHKKKSIDEVSKDLGHSKVSMTVDTYLHTKKRYQVSLIESQFFSMHSNAILKKSFNLLSHVFLRNNQKMGQ